MCLIERFQLLVQTYQNEKNFALDIFGSLILVNVGRTQSSV
ncbi:hypothetical protein Xcab_02661 [Xenorhabdus cabanillasii JM26]|nr:hypothetical protein Xcab_02661 [Xenorhabdus cabanillasii JM26]